MGSRGRHASVSARADTWETNGVRNPGGFAAAAHPDPLGARGEFTRRRHTTSRVMRLATLGTADEGTGVDPATSGMTRTAAVISHRHNWRGSRKACRERMSARADKPSLNLPTRAAQIGTSGAAVLAYRLAPMPPGRRHHIPRQT